MTIAPDGLLIAQAIHTRDDADLRDGCHWRVLPSTWLGLPLAPLIVTRVEIPLDRLAARNERDVFEPGELSPATSRRLRPHWWRASPDAAWASFDIDDLAERVTLTGSGTGTDGRTVRLGSHTVVGQRRTASFGHSALSQLRSSTYPYNRRELLSATAADVAMTIGGPTRSVALPAEPAAWYPSGGLDHDDSVARVLDAIPRRIGRDLTSDAIDGQIDHGEFVASIRPTLATAWEYLRTVLRAEDPAQPQQDASPANTNEESDSVGPRLRDLLLLSGTDPSVAHYLGLAGHDDSAGVADQTVVAFVIRGMFLSPLSRKQMDELDDLDDAIGFLERHRSDLRRYFDPEEWDDIVELAATLEQLSALCRLGRPLRARDIEDAPSEWRDALATIDRDVLDLTVVAATAIGHTADPPSPPQVSIERQWTVGAPKPRRVEVRLDGLEPVSSIALLRDGAHLRPRVRDGATRNGWVQALVPSATRDDDVDDPSSWWSCVDRSGTSSAHTYRAAQRDWFGRWSEWSAPVEAGEIEVGLLPAPALTTAIARRRLAATAPTPTTNWPEGVATHLETRWTWPDGTARTSRRAAKTGRTTAEISVPASVTIPAGGVVEVELRARWMNGDVARSEFSVATLIVPSEEPPTPELPVDVRWTETPDVLGRARYDLVLPKSPLVRGFHVWEAGTAQLGLASAGDRTVDAERALASIDGLRARRFERLTTDEVSDRMILEVDGALLTPTVFLVQAVGVNGTAVPLPDCAPFALLVPPLVPPPRPVVERIALQWSADTVDPAAKLFVRAGESIGESLEWRLRGSTVSHDAIAMRTLRSGTTSLIGGRFEIVLPIRRWRTTSFAVEVRRTGPGPAPWSDSSAVIRVSAVPEGRPGAPVATMAKGNRRGFGIPRGQVDSGRADPGTYIELWRTVSGPPATSELLDEVRIDRAGSALFAQRRAETGLTLVARDRNGVASSPAAVPPLI